MGKMLRKKRELGLPRHTHFILNRGRNFPWTREKIGEEKTIWKLVLVVTGKKKQTCLGRGARWEKKGRKSARKKREGLTSCPSPKKKGRKEGEKGKTVTAAMATL